jgi:hypothetical protein
MTIDKIPLLKDVLNLKYEHIFAAEERKHIAVLRVPVYSRGARLAPRTSSGDQTVNGQWAMGNGQWAMGNGQWAMGNGQWAIRIMREG